jgi:thioredoxin reductase (NADPH)
MGEGFDVVVLGSGPAGLQAAIHAARKGVRVLLLGKRHKSSAYGAHIENFCCTGGRRGEEMLTEGLEMARRHGAVIREEDVTGLAREGERFRVATEGGGEVEAAALVASMGISRKRLGVPGEKELVGRGVSYCVECDGLFFRGDPVAVVGDESAAVSGALTLLFSSPVVHLVCGNLQAADPLAESLRSSAVVVHQGRSVKEIRGQGKVEELVLDDGGVLAVAGIFIELGAKGAVELLSPLGVALDAETFQYVVANRKQETSVPGIYAAGDLTGPPWQMAKAVGEGCVAGLEAAAWAKGHRG